MYFTKSTSENEFLEKVQEYLDTKYRLQVIDPPSWYQDQE